jgi:hypothetical protein
MPQSMQNELPSTRRLLKATAAAVAVAGVILVTTILPAEFGIDPTGIGRRLGLNALAGTASAATSPDVVPKPVAAPTPPRASAPETASSSVELDAVGQPVKPIDGSVVSKRADAYHSDTMSVILPPGKGAEIKAPMKAGDGMVFHWSASGDVAFDMHGDHAGSTNGEYTSYWIERAQREASGTFTASFDGNHGWYWLNRGSEPVTVHVEVTGYQGKLFRPGHP